VASYSAVIDLRVNGLEQLKEIEDRVKAVQNIQKRLKPIPSIFDKRASAQVKEAKEELSSYVKEVAEGTAKGGHFSKTMAGLNAQMRAFNTVAANSNAGSENFVNSIIAAEKASRKLTEAEVDRLQVLSKIYTQQQGIGRTTATQEIIDLGNIIPKSIAGLELYEQQLREAQRQAVSGSSDYRELAQAIAEVNRQLDIARGIGPVQGPALPPGFTEAGATGFPRSPLSARPKTQTRQKGSPLVGAAFPALFGAGPAGILGGFIGEFFGPLGGVVGSALGAPVDAFIQSAADVGAALQDPIASFDELREKALLASKSQEKHIEKLIEAGRVNEAAAIIQEELVRKIGVQGVKDLQNAGAASEELNRAMAELGLQMQAAVAGPLAAFISWLADVVSISNQIGREAARQTDIFAGLSAEDQAEVKRQEQRILSGMTIFNEAQKREEVSRLYKQYEPRATIKVPGATTDQTPALRAAAQTEELQKQVDLVGKRLTLVGLTLEKDGARYIEATKAVALQEYDNKLTEIKNSWIGKIFDKEKNLAMIRKANLEYAAKLKNLDNEALKNTEMREKATQQANAALYSQTSTMLNFIVKAVEVEEGQEAGLRARIEIQDRLVEAASAQLSIERDLALTEAARNGTTAQVIQLYEMKRALLLDEFDTAEKLNRIRLADLETERAIADIQAVQNARAPFEEARKNMELQIQYGKTYLNLVMEGMLPADAERIANFERMTAEQLYAIDQQVLLTKAAIAEAEARGASADKIKKLREDLERINKARGAVVEEAAKGPGKGPTDIERVKGAIAQVKGELNELANPINFAINGAFAIANAFQQAFEGLATGAMTAQEALSAFFKSVGEAFVKMAAEIIAKQLLMIALQTLLKALGAAAGGGGNSTMDLSGTETLNVPVSQMPAGMQFAEGGFVTGPTRALIGEGGEPEYIIPASKMRTAMARYSAGARGSSVIPGAGTDDDGMGTGNQSAPGTIDVRYTVERINSVDYVTADQFQAGMKQAAMQGAKQGEQRTLARLQNAPSARRRIGI